MLYYVIDAFTEEKFGGNPAGVVIYDGLEEAFMQKFAAEVRFSETAFIKRIDKETFNIRFFTPTSEVELCGHATIASFTALLESNLVQNNNTYFMDTKSGCLPVSINDSFIMMEQAKPRISEPFKNINLLSEMFNIKPECIGDKQFDLKPQAASTGLWDLMLPLKTKEDLYDLKPNFSMMSKFSEENNLVGVHAFTLDSSDSTALCRNFAPLYGIDEEAATGTSNGALTYYLYKNEVLKKFHQNNTFIQGESMGRPSKIISRLVSENDPRVQVGGKAVILSKGNIF